MQRQRLDRRCQELRTDSYSPSPDVSSQCSGRFLLPRPERVSERTRNVCWILLVLGLVFGAATVIALHGLERRDEPRGYGSTLIVDVDEQPTPSSRVTQETVDHLDAAILLYLSGALSVLAILRGLNI